VQSNSQSPIPGRRREIPDGHLPGLYLVVKPSGAKAWAYRYRPPSSEKPAKLTIGSFPAFGLIEARKAAGEALRAVAEGNSPAALKQKARALAANQADTVSALLDEFLKRHVEVNNKMSIAAEHKRLIERNLRPVLGERRIQSKRILGQHTVSVDCELTSLPQDLSERLVLRLRLGCS